MNTLQELQKHVDDVIYKKYLFEARMKELKNNYEISVLTKLLNLRLDETIDK